jgi:hypothetical protein
MFVPKLRPVAALAMFLTATASLMVGPAGAQSDVKSLLEQRNLRQTLGANAVPLKRFAGLGDGRFLPEEVTRRSLAGVKGFDEKAGKTRVQIGGPNGANVQEQVVNITSSPATDQLTPHWTIDEQFLYYASKPTSGGGYQIRRVAAGAVNNPLLPGNAVDTAISNESAADHLFPVIDGSGNRIAFVKSYDGLAPGNPAKKWHLYVAVHPLAGGSIDPNPGGPSNLLAVTMGRTFRGKSFDSIGRVVWAGATTLIFSARMTGETNFHLYSVDMIGFNFQQLTSGSASEENPTVSPNGLWVAFDSNATPTTGGTSYSAGVPATEASAGAPAAATGVGAVRNIFTMPASGVGMPQQFTGRFTGAPSVGSVQPAWSTSRQNAFTNSAGTSQFLAYASTRQLSGSTVISGPTKDIYITRVSTDGGASLLTENSATAAVRVDTADPNFAYDDEYPAWSPIITLTRIALQSDRTGNYQTNNFPTTGFTGTPGVRDLFLASLIDISAPTLIRFDTNATAGEIVHINLGSSYNAGGSVRTREDGLLPGSTVFFTVRAEDRESGLRDDNDPAGGAVYLQFKNPNSLFQAQAQGDPNPREYKEYLLSPRPSFTLVENNDAGVPIERPFAQQDGSFAVGREFETQVLGMDLVTYFRHQGNNGPVYVPGAADAQAFSGSARPPLDGIHAPTNCWLKLNRLPDQPSDGRGGVLYGAAFTLPSIGSDWYVDVIMYDRASNPYEPGGRSNWIIYDNVWGFSTALPLNPQEQDVLFVSDYALGQKFFRSRFGDLPIDINTLNLQPIAFGAESYYTDTDLSRFPGESPAGAPAPPSPAGTTPAPRFYDTTGPFFRNNATLGAVGVRRTNFSGTVLNPSYPSTLGVGSYADETLPHTVVGPLSNGESYALPDVGRYSIWRILSRGPVPQTLLDAYLPRRTVAPADVRAGETAPRNIRIWNRLLVWGAPFAGNLFVGRGSITDLQTQDKLSKFVADGGRIFVSGTDIGFALAGNGQANNFFQNTLQASFGRDGAPGSVTNAVTAQGGPFRFFTQDPYRDPAPQRAYGRTADGITWNYSPPTSDVQITARNAQGISNAYFGDGAGTANFDTAYTDTISARPTGALGTAAVFTGVEYLHSGGAGIISAHYASDATLPVTDPTSIERKFLSGGSALYSSIGFESISQGWYVYTPSGATIQRLANLGRRAEIMANFTGAYRTGTIIGRVTDDNGSPVAGALVRAVRGVALENQAAWGTAITDASGGFTIIGLPPAIYFLFGYSPGYYTQHTGGMTVQGTQIVRGDVNLKRANPGRLQNIAPPAGGAIGAGVMDAGGRGIPNIQVQLRRLNPDGTTSVFTTLTRDSSNPQFLPGSYSLPDLPIGEYEIFVNWDTILDASGTEVANPAYNPAYGKLHVTENPQTGVTLGTGTVLVPPSAGTGVRLRIDEDVTSAINFVLEGGSQGARGNVVEDATGNPISGADVAAIDANGNVVASAVTLPDGTYVLMTTGTPSSAQIPAGNYTVTATARGYNSASTQVGIGGVGTITVPALRLTKIPGGGVRGLVTSAVGGGGLEGVSIKLFYLKQDGTTDALPSYTATTGGTQTDSTGFAYNFDIAVPTVEVGDYLVRFEKDGLVSNPVQVRVTVTSNAITRIGGSVRMESPRVYGSGIWLLSVPYYYGNLAGFSDTTPYAIFGLGPDKDNNSDGVINGADTAVFSQFQVADWTGVEYKIGNNVPILQGKGYFVRFGSISSVARAGDPGASSTFPLNLAPGWNLIGHPFANRTNPSQPAPDLDLAQDLQVQDGTAAPVSMAQAVAGGLVKSSVFGYSGSENGSQYLQTTVIKPWLGYWFRNNTNRTLKLIYNYPVGRSVRRLPARTITRAEAEAVVPRQIVSSGPNDWRLQLAARQGALLDSDNTLGVARDARDGYDNQYDNQEPPRISALPSLQLAVEGQDDSGRAVPFADQIRAPGGKKSWDITVEAPRDGEVTLYWPNANRLPRGIQPQLLDIATGRKTSLRSAASYRFNATRGVVHRFRIEVGPAKTAPLALLATRVTTVGGSRSATTGYRFSFAATQEADVQVEILTLTGRSIRRLETRATAGAESGVFWDGRSQSGAALPAGPYVVSFTARDDSGEVVRASLPLTKVR